MAGSLINLNRLGVQIPPLLIVDTSVIIDWLEAIYALGTASAPRRPAHDRALQFFESFPDHASLGLVTSVGLKKSSTF